MVSRGPEFRGEIAAISEHSSVYSEHKIANKCSHILVKQRSLDAVITANNYAGPIMTRISGFTRLRP